MTAQSVTGVGGGSCGKFTTKELSILANGPAILVAGRIDVVEEASISSPPSNLNVITLDPPLPGSKDNYVVILTGLNVSAPYVGAMYNNDDGDFYKFIIFSEDEGTCMYFVTKVGVRPSI